MIVNGGNDEDIAKTIWQVLNAGCGMKGNIETPITNIFGNNDIIKFDRPIVENLYIRLNASIKQPNTPIDIEFLKNQLVSNLKFKINDIVDSSTIDCLLTNIDNSLVYSNIELSKNNTDWLNLIKNTNINYIFTLSIENITINI